VWAGSGAMIHLGFMIDALGSSPGGTETQLLTLIRHIPQERFRVFLYVLRNSDLAEHWREPCSLHQLPMSSLLRCATVAQLARLRSLWKRHRLDILQTHFAESNLVGSALGRAAGIKGVITTRRNQSRGRLAIWRMQCVLNQFTDFVVVNAESTKRWVIEQEALPEEKVKVIYNAVDADRFRRNATHDAASLRSELSIPAPSPIVGICANLRPVKGHEVLLRAAVRILDDLPDVHFVLIGESDEDREDIRLKALTQSLGLREHVHFLGRRTDIPELLRAIDVGVLCSRSESMPNAIGEYLAAGLPVVSTDVGGVRELIEDGTNGFLVAVDDMQGLAKRIVQVLREPGRFPAARNVNKARSLCDVQTMVESYLALYESLASRF
jgi:glycosyltransferase involved in cell wall biosynthesis